jgi:putative ABC transport system substrate-binding protein
MELHAGDQLVRRREFFAFLTGAATALPLGAGAQQSDRKRRIAMLASLAADDPEQQARDIVFRQALQEFGWRVGGNVQIDYRWGADDAELCRRYAKELVALAPEVILATSGPIVAALREATGTVPIVFTAIIDPVALGYVASLARPGGNVTGFFTMDYGFSAKWLELLKQIAPSVTRAAVLRAPPGSAGGWAGSAQFTAIQHLAPSLGVELMPVDVTDACEIVRAIEAFATEPNGGLIVTSSRWEIAYHDLIVNLAAQHRLPAVYPRRAHVDGGGLISYGASGIDEYRRAAGYVARILKGDKPADLPVQAPTIYETVLNLKTAKALGLVVPRVVNARADQVIE